MKEKINNIKTRQCRKSDYTFVYKLIKSSLFPLIAEFQTVDKSKFDVKFWKDYKNMVILLRGKRRIGLYN